MDNALELTDIVKRFSGVLANDRVSLAVNRGEVRGLLGENGAGKSTLMNVVYGLYQPDSGSIRVDGAPARIRSPADALKLGIGMVPQHFALIPTLNVVENICLGRKGLWLRLSSAAATIRAEARKYGWDIDPFAKAGDLSPSGHQRIEILKAIFRNARILILDEPTSVLTPQQASELIVTLRRFADGGGSVIFISHKLNEVMRVSDRITVMRDGAVVATVDAATTTANELAKLMVGREVALPTPSPHAPGQEIALQVEGLSARGSTSYSTLRDVSFTVRGGEVFGVAGVDGNGQAELAALLCGLRRDHTGNVSVFGRPLRQALKSFGNDRIGHVPDDRRRQGLVLDFSTRENLVLRDLTAGPKLPRFAELRKKADSLFTRFDVKAASLDQPVRYLSGGNQQRIVLARETSDNPGLLIAVQPTQGLDIAATRDVYEAVIRLREQGSAIVYISTELEEILALSDRIGVMSGGALAGILEKGAFSIEEIGMMMAGSHG